MKKWNYEFNPSEYANKKSNSITLDEIFSQMKEYPELRNKTEKLLKHYQATMKSPNLLLFAVGQEQEKHFLKD